MFCGFNSALLINFTRFTAATIWEFPAAFIRPWSRLHQQSRQRISPLSTIAAEVEKLESRQLLTVTFNGGALLPNVEAQAVYLGSDWQNTSSLQTQSGKLDQFVSSVVQGAYMDMLTHAGYQVGRGTASAGAVDNIPLDKTNGITDSQIQSDIQSMINSGQLQPPDANRLYIVYVAPGVVIQKGSDASSTTFLGYHGAFGGTTAAGAAEDIHYVVVSYPGTPNFSSASQGFASDLDFQTAITSHELAEAVTDPNVNYSVLGWYDSTRNAEIGDLAVGHYTVLDGYTVQDEVDQNDQIIAPVVTPPVLTTPTLTATTPSSTTAQLSWGSVSQALGYRVYEINGSQSTLLGTLGASATSFTVTGLNPASTNSFKVEAFNGSVIADSSIVSATQPLDVPNVTATTPSSTTAQLSWGSVSQALGYRVYEINGSQSTLIGTLGSSATSFTVTGLNPASTNSFVVEAFNGSVTADSSTVSATQPLATPVLTATAPSSTTAELSWGTVPQAQGYRVYQITGSQSVLLGTASASTTSFQVNGLVAGTQYSFTIEAFNGSIIADSQVVSLTMPSGALVAPQVTAVALSPTSVSLTWNAVPGARAYSIYNVLANGGLAGVATVDAGIISYTISGLTPGSTMQYKVEVDSSSSSALSAVVTVQLPSSTVTSPQPLTTPVLTATALSSTTAQLSWGTVAQAQGYRVYQITGSQSVLLGTVSASTTSYQVNGLVAGTQNSFTIEAFNGSIIADSQVVSLTMPSGGLVAPQVTAVALSPTSVSLTWNAVPGARAYSIYNVLANGGLAGVATVDSGIISYTISGLTPGSTMQYKVEVDSSTSSALSAVVTVQLPA